MNLERDILVSKINTDNSEKTSEVKVLKQTYLSKGTYGAISTAEVEFKGKVRSFVLKKFHKNNISGISPQELVDRAFKNYTAARKAGLRVFPTYRQVKDEPSILMTNGNLENWACIGTNDESPQLNSPEFNLGTIERIENFDELLEMIYEQAEKAASAHTLVHGDSYMFLVNRSRPSFVDFVIADLDNLQNKETITKAQLLKGNIIYALDALIDFVKRNLRENSKTRYLDLIQQARKAYLENVEK